MAGNILAKYGSSNQAITITLAGLTSGSLRCSVAIDNSTNLFTEESVRLNIKAGTTPTINTRIPVYVAGSNDGGLTYTAGATGTDAAFSNSNGEKANLIPLGSISVASSTTGVQWSGGPWSVLEKFGATLPDHWCIVVENASGAAFDGTEGNHTKTHQGSYSQYS